MSRARNCRSRTDDEFYYADSIGLAAQKRDGETFGTVKAVHNFGAGDLLEIEPAAGGATIMLPFNETTVPFVDVAGWKDRGRASGGCVSHVARNRADDFPEMFPGPLGSSLAGKALEKGVWTLDAVDIRDHATDKHRTVDDTPAGGGPGMVMKADVLARAIDAAGTGRPRLLMSPRGAPLTRGGSPNWRQVPVRSSSAGGSRAWMNA